MPALFSNGGAMLANYLPVLIFLVIAAALAGVLLGLGSFLGRLSARHRGDEAKLSPYECGFEAFEDTRVKFDVRYYLVAILFIIFDLEIAFLFPWAVALPRLGGFGLAAMGLFLFILVIGFAYEWKKGALEWD
jgi:NADH-quinone oxidoreductase subunit A